MLSRRTLLTSAPLSGLVLGHSASTANTATYIDLPDGALFHAEITWALSKGLIALLKEWVQKTKSAPATAENPNGVAPLSEKQYCYVPEVDPRQCPVDTTNAVDKIQSMYTANPIAGTGFIASYIYDNVGRLLTVDTPGYGQVITSEYTYNAQNQVANDNWEYDADGNLVSSDKADFVYNSVNQNISSILKNGSNTTKNTFIGMTQKQLIAQESSRSGTFVYIHRLNDRFGNPVDADIRLVKDDGASSTYTEFDSYGARPERTTVVPRDVFDPFRYRFSLVDRGGTERYLFGVRWYSPSQGAWMQQDSLDAPLDPLNANHYAYAGGDPINNFDPTGLITWEDLAGKLAGGLVGSLFAIPAAGLLSGPAAIAAGVALGGCLGGMVDEAMSKNLKNEQVLVTSLATTCFATAGLGALGSYLTPRLVQMIKG